VAAVETVPGGCGGGGRSGGGYGGGIVPAAGTWRLLSSADPVNGRNVVANQPSGPCADDTKTPVLKLYSLRDETGGFRKSFCERCSAWAEGVRVVPRSLVRHEFRRKWNDVAMQPA
jgi:hypothetical protein